MRRHDTNEHDELLAEKRAERHADAEPPTPPPDERPSESDPTGITVVVGEQIPPITAREPGIPLERPPEPKPEKPRDQHTWVVGLYVSDPERADVYTEIGVTAADVADVHAQLTDQQNARVRHIERAK